MYAFIHSLIHSNDDWTCGCVPGWARSWGYGGDYCTVLGIPSEEGKKRKEG